MGIFYYSLNDQKVINALIACTEIIADMKTRIFNKSRRRLLLLQCVRSPMGGNSPTNVIYQSTWWKTKAEVITCTGSVKSDL